MAKRSFEIDEGFPNFLLTNPQPATLVGEEDLETGKVLVRNIKTGASHEFANMDEFWSVFSGWAISYTEGAGDLP